MIRVIYLSNNNKYTRSASQAEALGDIEDHVDVIEAVAMGGSGSISKFTDFITTISSKYDVVDHLN